MFQEIPSLKKNNNNKKKNNKKKNTGPLRVKKNHQPVRHT